MKSEDGLVLIVGATSKVGRAAIPILLRQARRVRALTRDPSRAGDLLRLGAEVVQGDLRDPASLERACAGVGQVVASAHALTGRGTNNPETVDGKGNRDLIDAALRAGAGHLVFVSARGAGPESPLDFFRIKHESERYLVASGLGYTILRAGAFMETWAEILGVPIARGGRVVIFGRGDTPIELISAEDVAAEVVRALGEEGLRARRLELGGPEPLTTLEMVRKLEQACGRKAKRVHLPVPVLRAMAAVVRPFDKLAHRMLVAGVLMAKGQDGSGTTVEGERHSLPAPRRFDEVARNRFRSPPA